MSENKYPWLYELQPYHERFFRQLLYSDFPAEEGWHRRECREKLEREKKMELKPGMVVRCSYNGSVNDGRIFSVSHCGKFATVALVSGDEGEGDKIPHAPYNGKRGWIVERKENGAWGGSCEQGTLTVIDDLPTTVDCFDLRVGMRVRLEDPSGPYSLGTVFFVSKDGNEATISRDDARPGSGKMIGAGPYFGKSGWTVVRKRDRTGWYAARNRGNLFLVEQPAPLETGETEKERNEQMEPKVGMQITGGEGLAAWSGTITETYTDHGYARRNNDGQVLPIYLHEGEWKEFDGKNYRPLRFIADAAGHKIKQPEPPILVRGNKPHVLVKVGCIEIPFNGAEQKARRMLTAICAMPEGSTVTFNGQQMTKEDLEAFVKWCERDGRSESMTAKEPRHRKKKARK